MIWLRQFAARFASQFRKRQLEPEMNEELRSHLEMLIEENLRRGMSTEEGRYAALRSFGGVEQTKEIYRDQRGLPPMETLLQDIRFGLRQLRRNPGFTIVAVLTLALGIGANTAIFSVVNAVMLRPLPYPNADRLAWIAEVFPAFKAELASGADYFDWRDQNQTLEQITAYDESASFNLTGRGTPERVHAGQVTASFFATLGIEPSLGRSFTAEEDRPNSRHVVVLTDAFWQQYLGSDRQVLGQTVTLDGTPYTVIGVMPASFRLPGGSDAQILLPLALNEPGERLRVQNAMVHIIARLKPTVSMARAHSDLDTIRKRMQPPARALGGPGGGPGPTSGSSPGPTPGSGPGPIMRMRVAIADRPPASPGGAGHMMTSTDSGGPETHAQTYRAGGPGPILVAPSKPGARIDALEGPPQSARMRTGQRQTQAPGGGPAGGPQLTFRRLGGASPSFEVKVVPLAEHLSGDLRPAILTLMGVVGLVLLIACANVANLMLARASSRAREVVVRAVLGAGRWRLVRQLLVESVMLAMAGGIGGLLLAGWGLTVITRFVPPGVGGNILSLVSLRLDSHVLLFALAVSFATSILFGLAPALAATRLDLSTRLKESAAGASAGARRGWLGSALVVAELSLALVLLIGAGLLIKSFYHVLSIDPGFAPERVLTMSLNLSDSRYPQAAQRRAFFSDVLRRVESLPGVRSAALGDSLPLSPYRVHMIIRRDIVAQAGVPSSDSTVEMSRLTVSPGYFYTLGIPVLRGRTFTDADNEHSPKVAVVNDTLARHLWPGEDPIGKPLPLPDDPPIVAGVVADTRHEGLSADTQSEIYLPYLQQPGKSMQLAVRAANDPASLTSAVRGEVAAIDPEQPIYHVATLEQTLSETLAPRRFNMLLLGVFAAIALALATVGIYGVMAFSVTQRTQEIGIRMALGAERRDVLGLVVRQGLKLILAGVCFGIAGAWALTRFIASFLYGVRPTDPGTFATVSIVLVVVAVLASYIPARRATQVDPMVALRYE